MKRLLAGVLVAGLALNSWGCAQAPTAKQSEEPTTAAGKATEDSPITYEKSPYSSAPLKASMTVSAMDTVMLLTVYAERESQAEKALSAAAAEIHRLDRSLSTNLPESEVYQINAKDQGRLGPDGSNLMQRSQEFYRETDGIFDIAIYPITKAWGFTTNHFQVPSQAEIQRLLPLCHLNLVNFDAQSGEVRLSKPGMGIDFGGIAKGYTSARLMEIFRQNGITSALVSLGGNVQLLNKKPDGQDFNVAIEDPKNPQGYIGMLKAADKAVITSGAYQRYFEKDGVRYHHIIDPRTGAPSRSDLTSVSIITPDGTLGDAYSTTLYILGREEACRFWREHSEKFEMVLVDNRHKVYISAGLKDRYQPGEGQPAPTLITKAG